MKKFKLLALLCVISMATMAQKKLSSATIQSPCSSPTLFVSFEPSVDRQNPTQLWRMTAQCGNKTVTNPVSSETLSVGITGFTNSDICFDYLTVTIELVNVSTGSVVRKGTKTIYNRCLTDSEITKSGCIYYLDGGVVNMRYVMAESELQENPGFE